MKDKVKKTRLYLIRHGEVEEKYHRIFGGRIDMELSPLGHEQARRLAEALSKTHFDSLYVSPMIRARQTLAPLARQQRPDARTIEGLREIDFGAWTGLSWEQVSERWGKSAFEWLHHIERDEIPNAENAVQFRARVEPCLDQILTENVGRQVAVVCHGGVIRMILAALLDLPLSKMSCVEIDYASISVVEIAGARQEIHNLNFTPWREFA